MHYNQYPQILLLHKTDHISMLTDLLSKLEQLDSNFFQCTRSRIHPVNDAMDRLREEKKQEWSIKLLSTFKLNYMTLWFIQKTL